MPSSGQYGTLHLGASEVEGFTNWTFCEHASKRRRSTARGTRSGTLYFTCVEEPSIEVGDDVVVKLYHTETDYYTVPVTIESIDMECDFDGRPVMWAIRALTDGEWT